MAVWLGGTGSLDGLSWLRKPKGMHWRAYQRLRLTALEASAQSWSEVLRRFGWLLDDHLTDLFIAS
jgi:hypothetical protein